jgi:hypothetical protein
LVALQEIVLSQIIKGDSDYITGDSVNNSMTIPKTSDLKKFYFIGKEDASSVDQSTPIFSKFNEALDFFVRNKLNDSAIEILGTPTDINVHVAAPSNGSIEEQIRAYKGSIQQYTLPVVSGTDTPDPTFIQEHFDIALPIIKLKKPSFTEQTPEEILDSTYKQLQSNLSEEILEKVLQQSPQFFERLVVDLLVKMGYGAGKITGRTGDGGIDGIIDEDKLGLDVIHIQAKRWQIGNNVGRRELQSFVGALAGQSGRKGVFITTSSFTREALEYNPSNVKIAKIDGKKLADLMITYNLGVSTKVLYELKKIDTDYFEE